MPAKMTIEAGWTFLTNHSHVLICLAQDSEMRLRDVAEKVGITERAVQRIVAELEEGGILTRHRDGRRNHYEINPTIALRHPLEAHHTIAEIIALGRTEEA
jgi:DNA-binding MarR family transcriptional regulator